MSIIVFQAAQFLAAAHSRHALSTAFPIQQIQESGADEKDGSGGAAYSNMVYLVTGATIVVLIGLVFGVLVNSQRKRARGITWFPEGFLRNNSGQRRRSRRRGPDGQEMRYVFVFVDSYMVVIGN